MRITAEKLVVQSLTYEQYLAKETISRRWSFFSCRV